MAALNENQTFAGTRLARASLLVAAAGAVGTLLGFWRAREDTCFAYLTAFAFTASIAIGSLIFLMTSHVVGARWSIVLRRLNEAITSVLPLLALLFLPIAFQLGDLYLWTQSAPNLTEHELGLLHHRQAYLNRPFFLVRTGVYFVIWVGTALVLWRWSLARDAGGEPRVNVGEAEGRSRERAFSAALLPPVSLALTFAAFDWLMSLEPLWSSTLFGVYYFAGGFVASFGLLAIVGFSAREHALTLSIRPPHFHALGRLMLGFTVFWAYCAFFQAMLVQMANRPDEVVFYVRRTTGSFQGLTVALILAHFVLPFFVLLPRSIKFRPAAMAAVGAWILLAHYLDVLWLVAPVRGSHGSLAPLWYLSALAAVGGACVAFAALRLRGKSLVPVGDPALAQSIAYRSPT